MRWHEDFGDAPSVEERMPSGLSPIEMAEIMLEANCERCECCQKWFLVDELVLTGMYEYYTMDIDPDSLYCSDCYEAERERYTPSDPSLYDCYTPLEAA
jgi:hypothetical protein